MTSNRKPPNLGLPAPGTVRRRTSSSSIRDDGRDPDDEEVGGRDSDVLGLTRSGHVRGEQKAPRQRRTKAPDYDRASLKIDFTRPMSLATRPITADGRTSFHFSHNTIRKDQGKGSGAVDRSRGRGAAARHGNYIERIGAVAKLEPVADPTVEQRGEVEGSPSIEADAYITRDGAVTAGEAGTRVLFTNISLDAAVRHDYWHKVEHHERKAGSSTFQMHVRADDPFWQQVRQEKTCPPVLRRLLDHATPGSAPAEIPIREAKAIRAWLEEQPGYDKGKPPATIRVGRAGHVQYRINGALPNELSHQGRIQALKAISAEFERRRLPYVAVLHAPDHHNDKRNWHYHIVYHDRPIERMPDGQWDFETRKTTVDNRMRQSTATLAQPKVREVAHQNWIPSLRARIAAIINTQLTDEGHVRRLDPRKHAEMGISTPPQEPLGSKASALEKMGIETLVGARNAARYWEAEEAAIEARYQSDVAGISAEQRTLQEKARASSRQSRQFLSPLAAITSEGGGAAKLTRQHALLLLAYHRARSRAEVIAEVYTRTLDAIAGGKATATERRAQAETRQRLAEAVAHLREVDGSHAKDLLLADQLLAEATRRTERLNEARDAIGRLLAEPAAIPGETAGRHPTVATVARPVASPTREAEPRPATPSPAMSGATTSRHVAASPSSSSPPIDWDAGAHTSSRSVNSAPSSSKISHRALPTAGASPTPDPKSETNRVEAAISELASVGVLIRPTDAGYRVDGNFLERRGVPPHVVASASMQRRLEAMAAVQSRELDRIRGYASSGRSSIERVDGLWRLATTAPVELKKFDDKWANDEDVQQHRDRLVAEWALQSRQQPRDDGATEVGDRHSTALGAEATAPSTKTMPPAPPPAVSAGGVNHGAAHLLEQQQKEAAKNERQRQAQMQAIQRGLNRGVG